MMEDEIGVGVEVEVLSFLFGMCFKLVSVEAGDARLVPSHLGTSSIGE